MAVIHPTAVVHPSAKVAENVQIGPHCFVGQDVTLGKGCVLMTGTVLDGRTEVGSDNRFFPYSVIGTDPQDLKYMGEESTLKIGNRNTFREHVTIHRGTAKGGGVTAIGDDNLFMACSHVAHDCTIGNNIVMANNVLLAGHITIEDDAGISGAVGIHHFTTVGKAAFVGGLTRIVRDVPPYMIVEGNPARVRGVNLVKIERLGFDENRVRALKEAYRTLWKSENNFNGALADLDSRKDLTGEVRYLVEFLRRTDTGEHGRALESMRRI